MGAGLTPVQKAVAARGAERRQPPPQISRLELSRAAAREWTDHKHTHLHVRVSTGLLKSRQTPEHNVARAHLKTDTLLETQEALYSYAQLSERKELRPCARALK